MSNDPGAEKRIRAMMDIIPAHWNTAPLGLAHEVRGFLASIRDEGTSMDSGGGDGFADLWVTVQGVEYYITVAKSNAQKTKDGEGPTVPKTD